MSRSQRPPSLGTRSSGGQSCHIVESLTRPKSSIEATPTRRMPSAYSAAWRSPCGVPGSLSAFAIQRWTVMRRSCRKRFALSDVSG